MEYVYASLLLYEIGKKVTKESIQKILTSVGIPPNSDQIDALLQSLEGVDIGEVLRRSVIKQPIIAKPETQVKAEKKVVQKEEPEEEMGLSKLFK